ncbi:MAG: protein translocase subunit SecF [Pseudohongiellaceae bacterium]
MKQFDFMGKRRLASFGSGILILVALLSLLFNSLQFGLDFTSGIAVRLSFSQAVNLEEVSATLSDNGYDEVQVVTFGSERDIRIVLPLDLLDQANQAAAAVETGEEITALLRDTGYGDVILLGSDFVSAKAGADLAEQSGLGLLVALACIMLYITVRFQFKFAVGAVAALVHDVIITIGYFSLFRLQVDLSILAAVLAVIGYSLNDTIIVADRIRENFRLVRKGTPEQLINLSINQTLSRTLVTSGTTLMVVVTMLLIGGEALRGFAIALTVGIVAGTYSSIYIAGAAVLALNVTREDLTPPVREGINPDTRP